MNNQHLFLNDLIPRNDYQTCTSRDFVLNTNIENIDENKSKIDCCYNLPWCLTDEYQTRNQLSRQDFISEIYTKKPTKYLFLAGLLHENIYIQTSASHINYTTTVKC